MQPFETVNNNTQSEPEKETHFTLWIACKFLILFALVGGFVAYNFTVSAGLLIATFVTALSIAQWRVFDEASNAFLEIEEEDTAKDKAGKVTSTLARRILYTFLDYGLAALSVALVVFAKNIGLSLVISIISMWILIDLTSAGILLYIYETKGKDLTLGRAYRRVANTIYAHSKVAGSIIFLYEATLATFWSGPDYAILFFKDEFSTHSKLLLGYFGITFVHSVLWTSVYWYGYENIVDAGKYMVQWFS